MLTALVLAALQVPSSVSLADDLDRREAEVQWRVGARFNIWTAFGEPANDIIGGTLYGSYEVHEKWWVGAEIYVGVFDFENPGDQVLGTSNTPTADAKIRMMALAATVEWHPLGPPGMWDVYVGAGLGLVNLGDGDAEALPQVDVSVDGGVGLAVHLSVGASIRIPGRCGSRRSCG